MVPYGLGLHIITSIFISLLLAFQTHSKSHDQIVIKSDQDAGPSRHRIAIIGAGAGGSSTAYHLAKFYNETSPGVPIEIDIFETNSRIGGRTTTVNALDDPRYPTEVGASIFVQVNQVLYNLTRDFGLSTKDDIYQSTGAINNIGIWDGSSFLFTIANDDSDDGSWKGRFKDYWDIAKLLWKYGLSPIRTQQAKNNVVSSFLRMYDEFFPVASLTSFVSAVGLTEYTGITGQAALYKNSVSEKFAREIVQSSTRVNYAQNLNNIHGVETMVCMAIEGVMAIQGGNWQIFDEAVKRSGASVHLNTSVTNISKTPRGTYQLHTSNTSSTTDHNPTKEYETVVLASPYQFSNLTFTPPLSPSSLPPKIDYVTMHVTLFTSPYRPSPVFFNLDSQDQVPDSILTTLPTPLDDDDDGDEDGTTSAPRGRQAVGPTQFWSLSTLRVLNPSTDAIPSSIPNLDLVTLSKLLSTSNSTFTQKQYLYKIFSPEPITATFLSSLFNLNYTRPSLSPSPSPSHLTPNSDPVTNLPSSQIPWSHTKIWSSYPYLPPLLHFPPQLLDSRSAEHTWTFNGQTRAVPGAENAFGVYYTSGIESFISTMETSAVMGRNVARVVVDGLGMLVETEEKRRRMIEECACDMVIERDYDAVPLQ